MTMVLSQRKCNTPFESTEQGRSITQLYRDLPLSACFEILKEAGIADFRWLFDMKKISASKIVFLQPRCTR